MGIKPILGCEVYVAPGSRFEKEPGISDDRSEREPKLLGTYGVSTKEGLAYEINYELIANNL